jgi:hypothetical protein
MHHVSKARNSSIWRGRLLTQEVQAAFHVLPFFSLRDGFLDSAIMHAVSPRLSDQNESRGLDCVREYA